MTKIHSTAVVDSRAELASDVVVGPFAIIDENVRIGKGTEIGPHAVITGYTQIGENNKIGVGVVIGLEPQDLGYSGQKSYVKIGNQNNIREYVQIHRGTQEESETVIGDKNFLLGFSHIAHNCHLGNQIILANGTLLAGHVHVEDFVFVSGHCMVHQFCRLGKHGMMRGGARISLDLPPYCIADDANTIRGINIVGLERRGFSPDLIQKIKKIYREVFSSKVPLNEFIPELLKREESSEIKYFLEFVKNTERGICRPAH